MLKFIASLKMKNPLAAMKALAQTVQQELGGESSDNQHVKDLAVIVEQGRSLLRTGRCNQF